MIEYILSACISVGALSHYGQPLMGLKLISRNWGYPGYPFYPNRNEIIPSSCNCSGPGGNKQIRLSLESGLSCLVFSNVWKGRRRRIYIYIYTQSSFENALWNANFYTYFSVFFYTFEESLLPISLKSIIFHFIFPLLVIISYLKVAKKRKFNILNIIETVVWKFVKPSFLRWTSIFYDYNIILFYIR